MAKPEVWPVLVHSKGRPNGATFKTLGECAYTVVVEPREEAVYRAAGHDSVVAVPEDGRGLAYSRQFGLELAQSNGWGWYWLLDDDVQRFKRREGTKLVSCSASEALGWAASAVGSTVIAQVALEYAQFAWSASRTWQMNSYADVVVANNAPLLRSLGIRYDESFPLKVDRDMTIQCIASGANVARITKYAFVCPKNGSNAGGLHEEYGTQDLERRGSAMLSAKWPWCVRPQTKPDGRQDAKIHWKKIVSPPSL